MLAVAFTLATSFRASATQAPPRSVTPSPLPPLTLAAAQAAAREASPDLRAAREAVAAARARERQAGALANPTFAYGREQTSRSGQSNSQDIAQLEQAVEVGGQRGARRDAARYRRESLDARLRLAERQLDFDVARAFATLTASTRRAALAESAANTFAEAERVITQRLAAGDVSGYAQRRLRLEAARYATQRAEVVLAVRTARLELAMLLSRLADEVTLAPADSAAGRELTATAMPSLDSLQRLALHSRADLRARELDVAVATADARLAAAERVPSPTLTAGYKRESAVGGGARGDMPLGGFVAGLSVPLPLFDRRRGSVDAANADTRRLEADVDALRRRIARDVEESYHALRAVDAQLDLLRPQLGESARVALRAVQSAYAEGEITLVEWLDAVRAYLDAESMFAMLEADAAISRAALERTVGLSLSAR